jgi:hypothetical protein
MSLKNLLVHVDTGPRSVERLRLAVRLAERHGALLTGVFAQLFEAHRVGVVAAWPPAAYSEAAAAARETFSAGAGSLRNAEWLDLNRGGGEEIQHRLAALACHFDLTILGQHDEAGRRLVPAGLVAHVSAESGRPVLVLPYAGHYDEVGQRPLFAWSETAAAARALNDALPLVAAGADALVVYPYERDQLSDFGSRVVSHLARHDVKARFEPFLLQQESVMDVLLNFASDHGADLMTLGLGGRAAFASFEPGKARSSLREMTLPVLCSG